MSKNLAVILTGIKKIEEVLSARLGENKLASYNTGRKRHKKQIAFHKCKKCNRWVFGGNRSGKTECGAVEAVYMARGIHPYRKNRKDVFGWVVSVSREVQRDVAQKKILSYYLMTRPSKRTIKTEKTVIEKDKERLYKKIRYERTKKTVGNQKSHRV